MHIHNLEKWAPDHDFEVDYQFGQKRSRIVLILTAATMLIEIIAGTIFGSMALLADGWHMATHTAAFGITLYAYRYAEKHSNNPDFTFSTGKVSVLGGFASAVALAVVALIMIIESSERMFLPEIIHFNEAIMVAVFGFLINALCVILLYHKEGHGDHRHDQNLKAAYFHVLADTLTSVCAIIALMSGKYFGWLWLDPVMGITSSMIIFKWSLGLLKNSSHILLDKGIDPKLCKKIISRIEEDLDNRVVDFHAWHISPKHISLIISLVTHYPKAPDYYKELLIDIGKFSHINIEVHKCDEKSCMPAASNSA